MLKGGVSIIAVQNAVALQVVMDILWLNLLVC